MSDNGLLALFGNLTFDEGGCPAPFISESLYPYQKGFYARRNCAPNPLETEEQSRCCIPCDVYSWTYSDNFKKETEGAAWVNVVGFILCGFLLISTLVLPAIVTRRNYLNIILLASIMLLELGFIVPLARQPNQCWDPITPNGMHSNVTCAFSGALVAFGLMAYITWILVRSVFMFAQIRYSWQPGRVLNISANVAAWAVCIGLTAAALAQSGVSARFGGFCMLNVGSISTYWGWLLAFGGLALLLQSLTAGYCLKVYVEAALAGRSELQSEPSWASSSRSRSARAAARRVRQVLILQWRSLAIIALAIFTTAFVCVIFIVLDDRLTRAAFDDVDVLVPWIICLLTTQEKNECLQYTGKWIVSEKMVCATLYILGLVGVEAFFLLCRFDIFRAWWELLRNPFSKSSRPVSFRPPAFTMVKPPRGAETDNTVVEKEGEEKVGV